MSSLLYYSISSNLTEDEITKLDEQVSRNRRAVYLFFTELPSNSKHKANAIALRDSLIDMPNRQNIIWYTDGQYQGGTKRDCDCVNLFDPDTNLIAVYQKQPDGSNLFLTTCRLTPIEVDHLMDTNGNFVTERVLKAQSAVSTNIQDNTKNNNGLQ